MKVTKTKLKKITVEFYSKIKNIAIWVHVKNKKSLLDVEDLTNIGLEAFYRAVKRYNPKRGASLSTYTMYRVKGSMQDAVREDLKTRLIPLSGGGDCSRYEIIFVDQADTRIKTSILNLSEKYHSDTFTQFYEMERVREILKELPELNQKIIKSIFWEGKNQKETSVAINRDATRIYRNLNKSYEMIERRMRLNYEQSS